jgi:hypothetical protein
MRYANGRLSVGHSSDTWLFQEVHSDDIGAWARVRITEGHFCARNETPTFVPNFSLPFGRTDTFTSHRMEPSCTKKHPWSATKHLAGHSGDTGCCWVRMESSNSREKTYQGKKVAHSQDAFGS